MKAQTLNSFLDTNIMSLILTSECNALKNHRNPSKEENENLKTLRQKSSSELKTPLDPLERITIKQNKRSSVFKNQNPRLIISNLDDK